MGVEGSHGQSLCAGHDFLCGDDLDSTFNTCMEAIDCKMHVHMAVHTDADPIKTFMRQMIPHHQNAVAMSKALLKLGMPADEAAGVRHDGDARREGRLGLVPGAGSGPDGRLVHEREGDEESFAMQASRSYDSFSFHR